MFENVSFIAQDGHITLISGPPNSGKSLITAMINGTVPFDGMIQIDGHDHQEVSGSISDYIYFVPQNVTDSCHWDVIKKHHDNIAAGIDTDGTDIRRILKVLDPVSRHYSESGNAYRKRVALAAALISNRPNILLDSPLYDMNPNWRKVILDLLRHEADRGRTIIVTTSDVESWAQCSDQVLYIEDAKLSQGRLNTRLETGDPVFIRATVLSGAPDVVRLLVSSGYAKVRASGNSIYAQGYPGEMVDILALLRDSGTEVIDLDVTSTPFDVPGVDFNPPASKNHPSQPSLSKFRYWMDSAK